MVKETIQNTKRSTKRKRITYETIKIPPEKKDTPETYTTSERRSEILQLIMAAGHPKGVKKVDLADRFQVSPTAITKDFQAITPEIYDNIGKDTEVKMHLAFEKVVTKGLKSPHFKDNVEAVRLMDLWYEWLFKIGKKARVPIRHEMDISIEQKVLEAKQVLIEVVQNKGVVSPVVEAEVVKQIEAEVGTE